MKRSLIIIFLVIFLVFSLILSGANIKKTIENEPKLSAYSDKWNGLSKFRNLILTNGYETSAIISSPVILNKIEKNELSDEAIVVIGVEKGYRNEERDAIIDFVSKGGSLLIADDFGHGNTIANYFGINFAGKKLRDVNYDKNPIFVKINVKYKGKDYQILLNDPSAIDKGGNYEIIANASKYAWLDENKDDIRDIDEKMLSYSVVVFYHPYKSSGRLIFVSDPGLFINNMLNRYDNENFALALVKLLLPNGGKIIFDESRHKAEKGKFSSGILSTIISYTSFILESIMLFVFISIFTIWIFKNTKKPSELKHRDILSSPYIYQLYYPHLTHFDYNRLRNCLLEKVRIGYNMSYEEFYSMKPWEIIPLIGDEELERFLKQPVSFDIKYFNYIMEKIAKLQLRGDSVD
ncbi:MAG: DUF4350 domain-containing protein [Candidatus Thermoplasmatota archaeon]